MSLERLCFGQRQYISYPEPRFDAFGNEFSGVEFNMVATLKIKQPIASWWPMSSWVWWLRVHLKCYFLQTAQQAVSFRHHGVPKVLHFAILITNLHMGATTFITTLLHKFSWRGHAKIRIMSTYALPRRCERQNKNNVYLCLTKGNWDHLPLSSSSYSCTLTGTYSVEPQLTCPTTLKQA